MSVSAVIIGVSGIHYGFKIASFVVLLMSAVYVLTRPTLESLFAQSEIK